MLDFTIGDIINLKKEQLKKLEDQMGKITSRYGILDKLEADLKDIIIDRMRQMNLKINSTAEQIVESLNERIRINERELYNFVGVEREDFNTNAGTAVAFGKFKEAAYEITSQAHGFFLKREKAEEILRAHPPEGTIKYLGYKDVDELLKEEDVMDVMSATRFTETDEWMHKTFDVAYSKFTSDDFEPRKIELHLMGPQWKKIGEKFSAKKHHNVSHLKEFGVIFLNPVNQATPGALMRDFALFFHYFHEVAFYSDLFELHAQEKDFAEKLKSFLRGDVPQKDKVEPGEWLIVQRYLWKVDPNDPRLFLPRVNPEALHWHKGEVDMVEFGNRSITVSLGFWDNLDWVGGFFLNKKDEKVLISFDLEDNAMSHVSAAGNHQYGYFKYHQQEAIWNELFRRYVGEEARDKLILENFKKGSIQLG